MDASLVGTMLTMNICGEHVEKTNRPDNKQRIIPPAYEIDYLGVRYNDNNTSFGGKGESIGSLEMTFQVRRLLKSQNEPARQGIIKVRFYDERGLGNFDFFGAAFLYCVIGSMVIKYCRKAIQDTIEAMTCTTSNEQQ